MKDKFTIVTSQCVPLPLENVDTDQIVPARFLKATTKQGFGDNLFRDWRFDKDGNPKADFVLNQGVYSGSILVAGKNFGSGSSREHAAWAIVGYGFRVVISSFFADIFKNNALNNGLLPVVVSPEFLKEIFSTLASDPKATLTVNLPEQTVTDNVTGRSERFEINAHKKECLIDGIDDIDWLLRGRDKIEKYEHKSNIEILDTTLRDGEQTSGVSFSSQEKLGIVRSLLQDLCVDRVEIASAMVSDSEEQTVRKITEWASQNGFLNRLEVLGFVDGGKSVNWINQAGCKVMNLLCKGSLRHVTQQLKKDPDTHIKDISNDVDLAVKSGIEVNIYLEDWSNGICESPEYVFRLVDALTKMPVKRIMLPDTLGVLNPITTYDYCSMMVLRYPSVHFDFHAHNDYDLAVANVFSAVRTGVHGIHTTVNGLGERAGNAPLSSVLAVLKDHLHENLRLNEKKINQVSRLVEVNSGIHIPQNKPVVGEYVFTQCAGVHADGDSKSNLYCNALLPERFGRVREYALGKNSGKANIRMNLQAMGIDLDDAAMRKVTKRIIELGDKKEQVTQNDLPYIVSDVLHHDALEDQKIRILNYSLSLTQGLRPQATVKILINGEEYQDSASGDGQYDAFVRALRNIYAGLDKPFPTLTNYTVSIPPGGKTDAFVQTIISWNHQGMDFKTRGLDADQTEAAIKATIKMLNKIEK